MTTQGEFEIDEGVSERNWNRCESFLRKRRRIVFSITICVATIVLFSVFVTLIIKSRYQGKDVDSPKAVENSSKGIYKNHSFKKLSVKIDDII